MLGNEATQAEKLRRKSIDELKEIVRLSRIRNGNKLTTEDLIVSILKSQRSNVERNDTQNSIDVHWGSYKGYKFSLVQSVFNSLYI